MGKKRKRKNSGNDTPNAAPSGNAIPTKGSVALFGGLLIIGCVVIAIGILWDQNFFDATENASGNSDFSIPLVAAGTAPDTAGTSQQREETRYFSRGNLTMVWDRMKPEIRQQVRPISAASNIAPADYVGPDACAECHQENHTAWSNHPHRWMNALANKATVQGDFSDSAEIEYRGGTGRFRRVGEHFRMSYDRGEIHREYEISQTIGSRLAWDG